MNPSRMLIGLIAVFISTQTNAGQLTGDTKLSCEAILCLSSATLPSECSASLKRYFNIWDWDAATMARDRLDFLNKCPVSNSSPQMSEKITRFAQNSGFYRGKKWFDNIDDYRNALYAD
ncbi:MAG: hypothetical protein EPN89_09080 [Methylovulum sp.]|nr:MAG: hypothetical protein EPN89_09080 [Methylovulum sp.]